MKIKLNLVSGLAQPTKGKVTNKGGEKPPIPLYIGNKKRYKHVQLIFYKDSDILDSQKNLFQYCDVCNNEQPFARITLSNRPERIIKCLICGTSWP